MSALTPQYIQKLMMASMPKPIFHVSAYLGGLEIDTPPLEHRTKTEPIRAWRAWDISGATNPAASIMYITHYFPEPEEPEPPTEQDFFLHSVTAGVRWDGPILRANAPPADYGPHHGGSGEHGIYAYLLTEGPRRALEDRGMTAAYSLGRGQSWAEGEVELFGKVVAHERGYRAEACRITRLYVHNPEPDMLARLEDRYACTVEIAEEIDHDRLRTEDAVDPDCCPMCKKNHPDRPLDCETEGSGDGEIIRPDDSSNDRSLKWISDSLVKSWK